MSEIAILGTGRMGTAAARRLLGAGMSVAVWNRTRDKAEAVRRTVSQDDVTRLRIAHMPEEAVAGAVVVLVFLADGPTTLSLLTQDRVYQAVPSGAVIADLGTSGVTTARELERAFSKRDIAFIDAPVSGSVSSMEAGSVLVMAGGPQEAIQTVLPVLKSFAKAVIRVGDVGAGQLMKLCVNLILHDLNVAIVEALRLAEHGGIPRHRAYDVFQQSVLSCPFIDYKRSAYLEASTVIAMSLALAEKDLRMIVEQARQFSEELRLTTVALETVRHAVRAGFGDRDMASLIHVWDQLRHG